MANAKWDNFLIKFNMERHGTFVSLSIDITQIVLNYKMRLRL